MSDDYKGVQAHFRELTKPKFYPKGTEVEGALNARGGLKLGKAGHRLGKKGPNQKVSPHPTPEPLVGTNKERFLARKALRDSKRRSRSS